MDIEDRIIAEMGKEAEQEASASGPATKESWKKVAAQASWNFTKTKGLPAFKAAAKFIYAQGMAVKNRAERPVEKKASALRVQDVTALGSVAEIQRSVSEKNALQISFIASDGILVETFSKNAKFKVIERGKVR